MSASMFRIMPSRWEAGEIRSYWDFLQPRWKGRILSRDPKISGSQRIGLRMFYHTPELGAEFIRRSMEKWI